MAMTITNLTNQDYWFGPLHLPAGNGQTLIVDDTSDTSLYLTDDTVADAINTLYAASPAKISVTGAAGPFPRATGTPEVLHGTGSPEGMVYAGQGSIYLRRDNSGGTQLYQKTTGIHVNTGWIAISGSIINPSGTIQMWGGTTAPLGYLMCNGAAVSRSTYADLFAAISTGYGAGDGSTTFNVPDLQGRIAVGLGTNASVNALGLNDGQSVANRRPHHRTTKALSISDPGHVHVEQTEGGGSSGSGTWKPQRSDNSVYPSSDPSITTASATTGISISGSIGTNNANDALDTPSFIVVNYIIKT
jgi:microcystin-dependent protein